MTRRITVALVTLVLATMTVAALGTIVLTRSAERSSTLRRLEAQADSVAEIAMSGSMATTSSPGEASTAAAVVGAWSASVVTRWGRPSASTATMPVEVAPVGVGSSGASVSWGVMPDVDWAPAEQTTRGWR